MPVGTQISDTTNSNFEFLNNGVIDESQQLQIFAELGYIYIPPRNAYSAAYMSQNVNNPYFSPPGGKQGESFIKNDTLRRQKSVTLEAVTNGVMPPHIDISGAPYCTFIEGTLKPNVVHPFYDLIKGPKDAPTYPATSTLEFVKSQPAILNQFFQANSSQETQLFNTLGSVFIPGTTKTSNAVAAVLKTPIVSYNIWEIKNLGGSTETNKLLYFNFEDNLGFIPKSGAQIDKIQPYAQTWCYPDTAQIQVYASNSQVTLTRKYPICKDYAHDEAANYLIYNSATTETPELEVNPVGLSYSNIPTGFVIKFSSVVLSNNPPTQADNNSAILAEPRIIVSWGDLEADEATLTKKYTNNNLIGKYTLEISPNKSPRLFFNINTDKISNINAGANNNSVELNDLKQILSADKNSGAKSPNDYELYVYYSGPYLKIGNNKNPSTWQVVRNQKLKIKNSNVNEAIELNHYLNEKTKINIQAQYVNFVFSYGPPLFSPHDDQNIPALTNDNANTLNFSSGYISYDNDAQVPTEEQIQTSIINSSARTFDPVNNFGLIGGATAYHDARAKISGGDYGVTINKYTGFFHYKISMPKNLGGNVFNKFVPGDVPEPDIDKSYVKYDLFLQDGVSNISSILSNAITSLKITKQVDPETSAFVKSDLSITLINLNKSPEGLRVLQFMRQNVCVLRISAGYGTPYPYFEGMVSSVEVHDALDVTEIHIKATDLMNSLFINPKTMIMSRQNIQFPGMRFNKIINSLVYHTELYEHFKYDLGDPADPRTIAYFLENDKKASLPKLADSFGVPNLAQLQVGAYDDSSYTYFKVLKTIRDLSLQINTSPTDNKRYDVPIYYWFTNGSTGFTHSSDFKDDQTIDGIVMSSRTLPKDEDLFYIRKESITELMTRDINEIHGYLEGNNAFVSSSSSDNLMSLGLYRFIDLDTEFHQISSVAPGSFGKNGTGIENIEDAYAYIGYQRIVLFDKPSDISIETSIDSVILPDKVSAQDFVDKWMSAAYGSVYEEIQINAFVVRPLKEWGYFSVCVESSENKIQEQYLYSTINYDFDINSNLIKVSINASKRPIQAF